MLSLGTLGCLHNRSNQPMKFDENVIVYNGEIYNFIEIKKILAKKGITFQTNSDTEVLLRSVLCFKDKCFDYLDGMFSFALFDNQKLKIATDPFGEKPLYVFEDKDGIYFCSEARPLINFLKLKFNPTSREIASFLSLGFIPNGGTGYNSLRVIEPAKLIVFNSPTSSVEKKYWSINSFNTKSELNNNFIDIYRKKYPDKIKYSWWNYRFKSRERNVGWRIDYFLVSPSILNNLKNTEIHNEYFGSDHCPVSLELSF